MALPELISIDPISRVPVADIVVPGSKSITNRALIAAALGSGRVRLEGALWSEDTQVMVACLQRLGFSLEVLEDAHEASNRTIVIDGQSGQVPPGGSREEPLELFVGNAGTAARFLLAFLCLGSGYYRLHGVPRMHERPQAALIESLRQLGYVIEAEDDHLPALICGAGPRAAGCRVDIGQSSQFASALLLSAEVGGWDVSFFGKTLEESPYVGMTMELVKQFGAPPQVFQIEPDASSGSYFWGLNALGLECEPRGGDRDAKTVQVQNWPTSGWQIDAEFPRFLGFEAEVSRDRDLGDSIMTGIVLAARASGSRRFVDLARLRVQECERVLALRTELARCGINAEEREQTLTVHPGSLNPAVIETYDDHRMAMCFSLLALCQSGIQLKDPNCVKKTFPSYFLKLSSPAPHGMGAIIREGKSGEILSGNDLIAE